MSAMTLSPTAAPLLASGLGTLPRVNLLPPEIELRRRFRRIQWGLGGAVVATVAAVAVAVLVAAGDVNEGRESVEAAQAESARLQAEAAKYADVSAVYAQAAAAQAMLTEAMGQEVRYSRFLSDLALSVPENVWLTNLTYTQAPVTPAVGVTEPGVGTLTVTGKGFSHDDVALWLESLGGQATYTNPYFSSSSEMLIGQRKAVEFSSTATLTPAALSGRYTQPAGG